MKKLLLTYDVEEFDWSLSGGRPLPVAEQIEITAKGLRKVLTVHERHHVPATFFVTGAFAAAEPELVAETAQAGHEIAVHGLEHRDDYANLEPAIAIDRLKRARKLVEAASGQEAVGIRTPRLRSGGEREKGGDRGPPNGSARIRRLSLDIHRRVRG